MTLYLKMGKRLQALCDQKVVDQHGQEVIKLNSIISLLQKENEGLKNQLNIEVSLFHYEKSRRVTTMKRTLENIFQDIFAECGDK
jgi:hypothetical protein